MPEILRAGAKEGSDTLNPKSVDSGGTRDTLEATPVHSEVSGFRSILTGEPWVTGADCVNLTAAPPCWPPYMLFNIESSIKIIAIPENVYR